MDASPYVLLCNTPAPRVYPLFARLGVSAACVVDSRGEFHSVLTREMVIEKSVHAHEGPGAHDPSGRWPASDEDLEAGGGSEGESVASDTVSALSSFDDKSRRVAMLEDRVRQLEAPQLAGRGGCRAECSCHTPPHRHNSPSRLARLLRPLCAVHHGNDRRR